MPVEDRHGLAGNLGGSRKGRVIIQRAGVVQHPGNTQQESEVANAIDQEGLEIREDCRRPRVPETDQQVGHHAHRLPAEKQLHEVV